MDRLGVNSLSGDCCFGNASECIAQVFDDWTLRYTVPVSQVDWIVVTDPDLGRGIFPNQRL
jgi:hypothetical protein